MDIIEARSLIKGRKPNYSGGGGEVYIAMSKTGIPVAIKTTHPGRRPSELFDLDKIMVRREILKREIDCALRFGDHPNIPSLLCYGIFPFGHRADIMVQQYAGTSAKNLRYPSTPRSISDIASRATSVARVLGYLEQNNVVHQDVKPSNILTTDQGITSLADFGIAMHWGEASTRLSQGFSTGTPSDTSNLKKSTPKSKDCLGIVKAADRFALGVTLTEFLFGANSSPDLRREVLESVSNSDRIFDVANSLMGDYNMPWDNVVDTLQEISGIDPVMYSPAVFGTVDDVPVNIPDITREDRIVP